MVQLSVLIPTYRRAQRLERCLQSVLASSVTDMEILVADNASPDETPEVLARVTDPRVRSWRNDTNVGAAQNVLDLLREAKGTWIFFLTDDDALVAGALERFVEQTQANPEIGVLVSSIQDVDADGALTTQYRQYQSNRTFAAGMDALVGLMWTAHLLSRLALRREWMDLPGMEKHLASLYPQMYLLGSVLREHPGLYLDEFLVLHTTGNQTHWEYHPDFMVGARVAMIKDLLPADRWRRERQALLGQVIQEIRIHHMPKTLSVSRQAWMNHQRELLKTQEIASASAYWLSIGRFWIDHTYESTKSAIIKGIRKGQARILPQAER